MNRDGTLVWVFFFIFSFFLPFLSGADAPHVYVRACTVCCFHSRISTRTFRRVLSGQLRRDKEYPVIGVKHNQS